MFAKYLFFILVLPLSEAGLYILALKSQGRLGLAKGM